MKAKTLLYILGGLLVLALTTGGFFWYQHYQAVKNAEPAAPDALPPDEDREVLVSPDKPAAQGTSPETPWYEVLHNELEAKLAQVQSQNRANQAEGRAIAEAYDALHAKRHLLSPEEFHREAIKIVQRKAELGRQHKAANDQLIQIQADHFRKLREGLAQHGGTQ